MSDIVPEIKRAKKASIAMASLPTATKDAALEAMAAQRYRRRYNDDRHGDNRDDDCRPTLLHAL